MRPGVLSCGWVLGLCMLCAGCETLVSDSATRIRFKVRDAASELAAGRATETTITLQPNGRPDGCQPGAGYRVTFSPYRGGKVVAVGDITVNCRGWRTYYTGLEGVVVTKELSVEKNADEPLRLTLKKTAAGIEAVSLE